MTRTRKLKIFKACTTSLRGNLLGAIVRAQLVAQQQKKQGQGDDEIDSHRNSGAANESTADPRSLYRTLPAPISGLDSVRKESKVVNMCAFGVIPVSPIKDRWVAGLGSVKFRGG